MCWQHGFADLRDSLPADSDYVRDEVQDMAEQLEAERRLTGDASAKTLMKEMVTVPGNRKRALISVMLMICQQMTGVNAIVCPSLPEPLLADEEAPAVDTDS